VHFKNKLSSSWSCRHRAVAVESFWSVRIRARSAPAMHSTPHKSPIRA
jgi:hypothetical protein